MQDSYELMTFEKISTLNWNIVENNGNYMLGNMTDNTRKRLREDDTCDFMPLSKRINNLHINNTIPSSGISQNHESSHVNGISISNHVEDGISSPNSSCDSDRRPSYDPGMSSSQSSYYHDNKLLFELHLERMQRTGQQFPF